MIPPISHPCWKKLVTGENPLRSSNLSFNMLVFNVRLRYKNNASLDNLAKLIQHAHDFFAKFETTLRTEVNALLN
jgi:hypothetical protein